MNDAPSEVAWGWRDVIAVGLALVVGTAAMILLLQAVSRFAGWERQAGLTSPVVYISALGFCALILASVYVFAARRSGWGALGFRAAPWQSIAATPLLLVVGLVVAGLANSLVAALQGGTFENPQIEALTGGEPLGPLALVMVLLLVAGLVPIAEEVLFRGMIYPLLRQRWRPAIAIVANAVIFAACHFILILFPALFVLGVMLAFLREWSKSIIPCIVYHAMQNGLAIIAINMLLSGAFE